MTELILDANFLSFSLASVGFLSLALLLGFAWRQRGIGAALIAACILTAVWAGNYAYIAATDGDVTRLRSVAEVARYFGWYLFLFMLTRTIWHNRPGSHIGVSVLIGAGVLSGLGIFAADLLHQFGVITSFWRAYDAHLQLISAYLIMAVAALALVENFYRNSHPANRWTVMLLCIALAAIFAFDVVFITDWLLFRTVDPSLATTRGFVSVLMVPLIAVSAARNPTWKLDVFLSRKMAFYTVSLAAAGGYLLLVAAAGFFFRELGGSWGVILQTTLSVAALVGLVVLAASGRVRAVIRLFLNKHFFTYNYDYREEWLRFIDTISSSESGLELRQRIIQAVADVAESPGGWLWLEQQDGTFRPEERWNYKGAPVGVEPPDSRFIKTLTDRQWIVEFDDLKKVEGANMICPPWAAKDERAWLAVPLMHIDQLIGFIVLERSRARRTLNWEDYDLLRMVGRHAASYVAEHQSVVALAEAREFDSFNRRFAFVMHDVKNLSSQLTLAANNAEKYADNPEFQRDMVATVRASAEKMNLLMARLSEKPELASRAEDVDLNGLATSVVKDLARTDPRIDLQTGDGPIWVSGESNRLEAMLRHLIQNGLDASENAARVQVAVEGAGDSASIKVSDSGSGMDENFVRSQLFKPFSSTKASGYGIGAYESKQIVESHKGSIDVTSTVGKGTQVVVTLPVSTRSMAQSRQDRAREDG